MRMIEEIGESLDHSQERKKVGGFGDSQNSI
jgi:hypothetical protein